MGKKTLVVSDLSGEEITNGAHAEVTIRLASDPKATYRLDALETEVASMLAVARKTGTRGRPRSTTKA